MSASTENFPRQRVVCAWCRQLIGTQPCEPFLHGSTSHSICPACFKNFMDERFSEAPNPCERGTPNRPARTPALPAAVEVAV